MRPANVGMVRQRRRGVPRAGCERHRGKLRRRTRAGVLRL